MDDRTHQPVGSSEVGLRVEEWREVPGYGGRYDVSSEGRVRSWVTWRGGTIAGEPRILKHWPFPSSGDPSVTLYHAVEARNGGHSRRIHCIVSEAFLGPRPADKFQVIRLDGNPNNFHPSNLAYATKSEAVTHLRKYARGRKRFPKGKGKLTDSQLGIVGRFYNQGRFEPGPGRVCVAEMARRYGVGRATIYRAIDRYREEEECQTGHPMKRISNSGSS
jgi:hypothetical protein